ncbi:uncharacterized protein LOC123541961 [Mercenaria mercenaria]|uniref:uncharacterized protein LOC123541961 n=1 Tax=Mercenaria mercenaria TaxID=6596 RepID=UPI00234EF46D|nr:uncharacterized protein LOC123541961 [Mercenaria mercenaria]
MNQAQIVLLFLLPCYVVALNECGICNCCKGGLSSCQLVESTNNRCLDGCIGGYYGALCLQKCINHCMTCSNYNSCTKCYNGYYGSYCGKCKENCLTCSNSYSCDSCKEGFYNGKKYTNSLYTFQDCPHECRDNCKSCTAYNTCTACKTGKYGTSCHLNCGRGCTDQLCDQYYGTCTCMTGFTGHRCEDCEPGKYGAECSMSCSKGCLNNNCNSNNGDCFPCKPLLTGNKCDQCTNRKYGDNCDKNCPPNCVYCSSDKVCSLCDPGYHGKSCDQICPENCAGNVCTQDGFCSSCKIGYYDQSCSTKCSSNCKECNQYSGRCKTCINGYHGTDCDHLCPSYCKPGTACPNGHCSECPDGFYYNSNCDNPCNSNCKICSGEYWKCTVCKDGKFGKYSHLQYLQCGSSCPNNCLNKSCNGITGDCEYGCINGYWGEQCGMPCSKFCKENKCFANNGTCALGCLEGFTGPKCNCPLNCNCNEAGSCYECKDNYEKIERKCTCSRDICTDTKCTKCSSSSYYLYNEVCCRCSVTCRNNECSSASKCMNGCIEGYSGEGCLELCKQFDNKCEICTPDFTASSGECLQCEQGYYPDAITRRCTRCPGNCADDTCSSQNGTCKTGCKDGKWGIKCENNCKALCARCNQIDGKCSVCKGGKYMADCSKECSTSCNATNGIRLCALEDGSCLNECDTLSKFGTYCEKNCSINCLNRTCHSKTGNCLNGCSGNFYGKLCDNKCDINCLTVNEGKTCNEVTGHCINGCNDGYFGDFCNQRCSKNCVNDTCYRNSGECFYGCVTGYTGSICAVAANIGTNGDDLNVTIGAAAGAALFVVLILVVIGVVLLIRKRHRRETSGKNDMTEINDNTDTAATYSEIVTTGLSVESNDTDAVYAMPNKPKKNIESEKKRNDFSSTKTDSNPNYEESQSNSNDFVNKQKDRKPPVTGKPTSLYDNTAVRVSVSRTPASQKALWHSEDSALEIEEDIDNLIRSSKAKSVILADGTKAAESDIADTYYNVTAVKKRKNSLDQLPECVSKKTKADFVEEFQQLPLGLIKPYVHSQKRANLSKNRYKGIYPYDDTRVVLKEGDSDYINASYIDGYNNRKAYIASIGPTFKYMGDMSAFWIMVWQEKVGKIVMLTKLDEGGAPKCDQYWPEKDFSLMYASIQVTCQSEESYADYTVRSFTLQKDSEKRKIVQVHFTAWPDKGVPDDVTSLIEFRQKVISTKTDLEGPILVHCSAGIGRTGTYIALDSLTEEGEAEGEVDIYAFVRNMREQRVNMVQTAEQYQYLHNALVHTLTFDSKAVEASKFDKYITSHTDDHLGEKFEKLQASVEQRSDDEVDAVKRNQALRNKNRVGADIPGDRNRPKLYLERKLGSSDYINAVYINSYTTINRYLVAQTPLPDTVVDFLTLLVQEKVSCIVSMETDSVDDKKIGAFYPADNQTLKKGTFTVKSKREKDTEQYVLRKLEIAHKGKSGTEDVTIQHIQFTHWNEHKNIPEEPAKFVQFVKDVEMKYGGIKSRGPILVHCLTGAEKSGLFCVVSNLLEKTQIDQETSVVNAVRQIKYRRHMSVPNKDQYIFCHQCVNEYLRTFDIYSNFELKT